MPLSEAPQDIKSDYFKNFKSALDDLFGNDELVKLCRENDLLAGQIISDTLNWFRKTYSRIASKNPYADEQRELESWGVRHLRQFVKSWFFLTKKVESFYTKEELDPSFHHEKFKALIKNREYESLSEEELQQVDRLLTDLLGQWDARLQAKILKHQLSKLGEAKDEFKSTLDAKVEEYQKLSNVISPFTDYIGRYWDMSRELWQDTSFNVLEEYDKLLKDEKSLKRLADILGKMREAEIETEEERYEKIIVTGEWVKDPNMRSEIVGVREDDDLNNLVSSEVSLLGDNLTETLFLKRFAEKQLLVNQYEDQRLQHSDQVLHETSQKVKLKEKGPFIVCVDTSGSMEGEPEDIAKVLCFAILKMAASENRRAFLINFSTGIKTIDLFNIGKSVDAVAQFLQMSFQGGTDISLALHEALEQLQNNDYKDADVLVVSDFIMYKLSDDISQRMEHQQMNNNTQFHSLIITDQANEEVIEKFDNVWIYDPDQKGVVKQLYRDVSSIAERKI